MLTLYVAIFSLAFGFGATYWLTRRYPQRLMKTNFAGHTIPAIGGLAFVLAADIFYSYQALQPLPYYQKLPLIYLLVAVGFGALGLLDDLSGDRSTGGFRGHFRRLFVDHKLTTGAIKAIGGGVWALVAGALLVGPTGPTGPIISQTLLAALLIALSANTLNLVDLRPGRCLALFFVGTLLIVAPLAMHHILRAGQHFYLAVAAAVILYPMDRQAKAMIGDTGANSFGAILGLTMALFFSLTWQVAAVVLLAAFQIWAEKRSLTKVIEGSPILSRIDRKIGVR